MENKKTIHHLNTRAWYRLLKVAFVCCGVIAIGIYNIIIFSDDIKKVDPSSTTIYCTLGQKKSFTAKDIDIEFYASDFTGNSFNYAEYYKGFNDYTIQKIIKNCYPKRNLDDIYSIQKTGEILYAYGLVGQENSLSQQQKSMLDVDFSNYQNNTRNLFGNAKAAYLDFSFHLFEISPTFSYNRFIGLFLIGNLVILGIFELIRRCFYYVVLGTMNPRN